VEAAVAPEPQTATVQCSACGAELVSASSPCPICFPPDAPVAQEDAVTSADEEAFSGSALWMRIVASMIYALVASLCIYGSVSFFMREKTSMSDWVFGILGVGLAVIALVGVKESLFPSQWEPD
jgi:hypothetical protein